jgi:four helix bundle protein
MPLQDYRGLEVWQRAMSLAEERYRATKGFPKEELFGLTS